MTKERRGQIPLDIGTFTNFITARGVFDPALYHDCRMSRLQSPLEITHVALASREAWGLGPEDEIEGDMSFFDGTDGHDRFIALEDIPADIHGRPLFGRDIDWNAGSQICVSMDIGDNVYDEVYAEEERRQVEEEAAEADKKEEEEASAAAGEVESSDEYYWFEAMISELDEAERQVGEFPQKITGAKLKRLKLLEIRKDLRKYGLIKTGQCGCRGKDQYKERRKQLSTF